MPRFVLLTHDHPHWHWDFMLENNGVLRSWRLDSDPQIPGHIPATPLPDHRLLYLEYEGPVSSQRGHVQRWDRGEYELYRDDGQTVELVLHGQRMQGRASLTTESDGSVWFRFIPAPGSDPA